MLKTLMLTTAITGLVAGGAFAQSPSTTAPAANPPAATAPAAKPDTNAATRTSGAVSVHVINSQQPDQWVASKFKGTDVVGPDDKKIGDVSDILFDKSGKIEAFIVSVGGFLGIGSKYVAMAPSDFQMSKDANGADRLKVSMTKDQLKEAANFEYYKEPSRVTTGAGGGMAPASRPATPSR